jgi:hypothetical protein
MRTSDDKKRIVEILSENPWIYIACKKVGISRATFYRWKKEDKTFASQTNEALAHGRENIKDVCEAQLMKKVKAENLDAIKFALQHNNKRYEPKKSVAPIFDLEDPDDPAAMVVRREIGRFISQAFQELKDASNLGLPPSLDSP